MVALTNEQFMSPYEVAKYLEGVIPGNKTKRQNWLQGWFGNRSTTEREKVNLDVERDEGNVMGQYVHPKADADYIQLNDFGTLEFGFGYSKEAINSDDFITLNQRQLGEQFGTQPDVIANEAARLRKKLGLALGAFENLKELAARDILFYGEHTAQSPKFAPIKWDFGRTTPADAAAAEVAYQASYAPELDLSTLNGNGGVGKRAWNSTGGTTSARTPYKDLLKIIATARRRAGVGAILMSEDAYEYLEADIIANYKDAANLSYAVMQRIELKVLPTEDLYEGLEYKRTIQTGVSAVDIFCYKAYYNDRITGTKTAFVPNGYVVSIPPANNQIIRYGRIMNRKANWEAMPIWVNTWTDPKDGGIEQEAHTSYVLAPLDINSVVSWKVLE